MHDDDGCPDDDAADTQINVVPSSINPGAKGVIPVVIYGSFSLDVQDIDLSSLAFGPNGAALAHDGHVADHNSDGILDLMTHFPTPDTGVATGDTSLCVVGQTNGGSPVEGCDDIRTVGRK